MVDEADNATEVEVTETGESDSSETTEQKPKLELKRPKSQPKEESSKRYDENYVFELKQESIEHRKESQEHKKRATQLEKQMAEMQKMVETQKAEFEASKKQQQDRIVKATLSHALTKAGCLDSDTAMSLLANRVEFTKDGDVKNGEELVAELKEAKSYFFTGPQTSNPSPTPRAKVEAQDVSNLDRRDFKKLLQSMGVKTGPLV